MSSRTVVYLHIGTWKTGTTAIQKLCANNRQYLDRYGLIYPEEARDGSQHVQLAWFFGEGNKAKFKLLKGDPWSTIQPYIGKADRLLLSSESLYKPCLNPEQAEVIKKKLQGADIRIIVYFRNQMDMAASAYAQNIKNGVAVPPLADWLDRNAFFFYDTQLGSLWRNFGKDNVIVKIYDKSKIANHRNYREFLAILGVEFSDTDIRFPEGISNPSIPNDILEFCRVANQYTDVKKNTARNRFLRDLLLPHCQAKPVSQILSPKNKKLLFDRYRESNRKLADMIGSDYPYAFPDFIDTGDVAPGDSDDQKNQALKTAAWIIDLMMTHISLQHEAGSSKEQSRNSIG